MELVRRHPKRINVRRKPLERLTLEQRRMVDTVRDNYAALASEMQRQAAELRQLTRPTLAVSAESWLIGRQPARKVLQ